MEPLIGRRVLRPHLRGASSEAEAREALQVRLTVLFKLMFWAFVALLAFLWTLYHAQPIYDGKPLGPRYNDYVYGSFAVGLALHGILWRGVLVRRRELSFAWLNAIDMFFLVGANVIIGGCALISYDFHPAAYTCVMYSCFTVLARALIVPSTGLRTAITTMIAFLPMTAVAIALPFVTAEELPGPAFVIGYLQLAAVAVLLSAAGSRIIYGLRRQVRTAQQLGLYTLERKIDSGGMGDVYLAHHVMLRRPTAIKVLRPDRIGEDGVARFEREVRFTSLLTHPNTVAVFDYGPTPDGLFYYAMEYLGGGINLEQLVRKYGPQPAERVAHILAQVCGALQEAHDRGIIHRDIKPGNIILCERGGVPDVAKVVDFGLVKEFTAGAGMSTQVILGTPDYLAPEAMTDPDRMGPPVDLYALGAVGYFLATGQRVFRGKTDVDVCIQHATAAPRPPSELVAINPELEAVILRCLEKRPDNRHASAAALATALRAIPRTAAWTDADARRFWTTFRAVVPAMTELETTTITVDLAGRA